MRQALQRVLAAGAIVATVALIAPPPAGATGPYSTSAQACVAAVETATAKLVEAIQNEIVASISANIGAQSYPCAGPNVCAGGPLAGQACATNAGCGEMGGVAFECQPQMSVGIASVYNKAKTDLAMAIANACPLADLQSVYGFLTNRCHWHTYPDLPSCIIDETIGQLAGPELSGTTGGILAMGAPLAAVDSPLPTRICGVTLGGRTQAGTQSSSAFPRSIGTVLPLFPDGCTDGNPVCSTKGDPAVGRMLEAPAQSYAGTLPLCIETFTADAGNGTTEQGSINLITGRQESYEPFVTAVHIGLDCPICDAASGVCKSTTSNSPHEGAACTALGRTDINCPIGNTSFLASYGNATKLDTEFKVLSVPANNPAAGVTNPAAVFCGACDEDPSIGCSNDGECGALQVCSGPGCCVFGTNPGAFGENSPTAIAVGGRRGAFIAQLAGVSCLGRTGNNLLDPIVGLPGPSRRFETRLNAFDYGPITSAPSPSITVTAKSVSPTLARTFTPRIAPRPRTPTRTPTRRPGIVHPCGDVEQCERCGDDPLCYCLCRNRYCRCTGDCRVQVCPGP